MKFNQSNKQNQRINRISETTLVIGTDIAKHTHVARAFNYRGIELGKRCLFQNDDNGTKVHRPYRRRYSGQA